ncbi:PREDICTED: C-type lectin domain family 4 member A-like [Nestor notabilis]|uniref:C-type lectin domain family 4 member A n=1 Tax=Nestor notabilis TaxID=176057 RepID=A0A091TE19_NESNO|nr:PREDICTED: C-type lectin domain family 4 member A-like [Nestor notabilis]KFQ57071.1 C-type lectin domain family 4 member A [Nestor notabilis]
MASEITYAEVKFQNTSPSAVVKVPPETKKHEHHPQKYPLWLPWLISLLLLLVCIALVTVLLVAPFSHSSDQPAALKQKFKEWWCDSAVPEGKEEGWTCCPKGWKRFQGSCYFISGDAMSWAASEQNCTGMGSHLVVINSEAEQDFLSKEVKKPSRGENHYIGLSAQSVSQWHWVDQTPFNVSAAFWREGEPSNTDHEKCVVIHRTSRPLNNWNDVPCNSHNRICEAAAITV